MSKDSASFSDRLSSDAYLEIALARRHPVRRVALMTNVGRMAFTVNADGRSSLRSLRGLNFLAMSVTGADSAGIADHGTLAAGLPTWVVEAE